MNDEEQVKVNLKAFLCSIGRDEHCCAYHESPMVMKCAEYASDIDHHRLYSTESGQTVLVCSNYDKEPPKSLGMLEIDPIYNMRARSFCAVFENRFEYMKAMYQLRRETRAVMNGHVGRS